MGNQKSGKLNLSSTTPMNHMDTELDLKELIKKMPNNF